MKVVPNQGTSNGDNRYKLTTKSSQLLLCTRGTCSQRKRRGGDRTWTDISITKLVVHRPQWNVLNLLESVIVQVKCAGVSDTMWIHGLRRPYLPRMSRRHGVLVTNPKAPDNVLQCGHVKQYEVINRIPQQLQSLTNTIRTLGHWKTIKLLKYNLLVNWFPVLPVGCVSELYVGAPAKRGIGVIRCKFICGISISGLYLFYGNG